MTKEDFLKLNKKIGELPTDISIRKQYLEKQFPNYGLSKENGYKAVQYFYNELCKTKDGKNSVFEGELVTKDDFFAIVNFGTCYFKMNHKNFEIRKELFYPTGFNTTVKTTFKHKDENLKDWILSDFITKFKDIEKELFERGYLNKSYQWKKHKTELIEFLCVISEYKYFKHCAKGKPIKDFHKRQFISERYGYGKTGLTETSKKYKPTLKIASSQFYWIKKPD